MPDQAMNIDRRLFMVLGAQVAATGTRKAQPLNLTSERAEGKSPYSQTVRCRNLHPNDIW